MSPVHVYSTYRMIEPEEVGMHKWQTLQLGYERMLRYDPSLQLHGFDERVYMYGISRFFLSDWVFGDWRQRQAARTGCALDRGDSLANHPGTMDSHEVSIQTGEDVFHEAMSINGGKLCEEYGRSG